MWKIFQKIIPNDLHFEFYQTRRHGVKCKRPKISLKNRRLSTIRDNYFTSVGPALFNSIPDSIKSSNSLNIFKNKLDNFLKLIPDHPPLPNYIGQNKNSLLEWTTGGGESPYSRWKRQSKEEMTHEITRQACPTQELAAF